MQEQEQSELTDQRLVPDERVPDASDEESVDAQHFMSGSDEEALLEDYPEEEMPDEEAAGAKYQVANDGGTGGAFAVVGDYARMVNINYIVQVAREARQELEEKGSSDHLEDDFQGDLYQLIGSALASTRQSELFPVQTSPGRRTGGGGEPESTKALSWWNEEEIAAWYYALQRYEQCYVQAVAIFHGAQASEVSRRADGLYLLFKIEQEQIVAPTRPAGQVPLPPSLHERASAVLYKRTHTFTQRVDGVERLFWSDVDTYGQSIFGLRFLDFLARELLSKGEHGKTFLDHLERWSLEGQEECRLFAARALGIFLWRQDVATLRQKASKWARNRSLSGWRRTAMLLDGAYEIDCLNQQGGESPAVSCVLALLQEWGARGQNLSATSSSLADVCVRCAAANTYELLGKHAPEIAMQGLEQLVHALSLETKSARLLVASVISAYVSLGWSGHLSAVLTYLARIAEQALLRPVRPATFRLRLTYQQQCEVKLDVSLNVFFFIAATSLAEATPVSSQTYEQPLADPPVFPDPSGRNVILAGLVTSGSHGWFEQVVILVAAAIMEKKRRYRSPAFDLMQEWVHALPHAENEREARSLQVFRQFLLKLDSTLEIWCCDLKKRAGVQTPAHLVYRKQLLRWARQKGPISALARDILTRLHSPVQEKREISAR